MLCASNEYRVPKGMKFFLLIIGVIFSIGIFGIPQIHAESSSNEIIPVYLDFKFKKEPVICVFSTDEHIMKVGIDSVLDWQNKLKSYTKDPKAWNMITSLNPSDTSGCTTEIHFLKKPSAPQFDVKAQGITIYGKNSAYVEVFTTQYYDDSNMKYTLDGSNKLRPVPGEFTDVSFPLLGKVTRHELGHVFGLSHQQSNSIMVTGQILAKITDKDCQRVIAKYGKDWS